VRIGHDVVDVAPYFIEQIDDAAVVQYYPMFRALPLREKTLSGISPRP